MVSGCLLHIARDCKFENEKVIYDVYSWHSSRLQVWKWEGNLWCVSVTFRPQNFLRFIVLVLFYAPFIFGNLLVFYLILFRGFLQIPSLILSKFKWFNWLLFPRNYQKTVFSGEMEVNWFTWIRLILEATFGDDSLNSFQWKVIL